MRLARKKKIKSKPGCFPYYLDKANWTNRVAWEWAKGWKERQEGSRVDGSVTCDREEEDQERASDPEAGIITAFERAGLAGRCVVEANGRKWRSQGKVRKGKRSAKLVGKGKRAVCAGEATSEVVRGWGAWVCLQVGAGQRLKSREWQGLKGKKSSRDVARGRSALGTLWREETEIRIGWTRVTNAEQTCAWWLPLSHQNGLVHLSGAGKAELCFCRRKENKRGPRNEIQSRS